MNLKNQIFNYKNLKLEAENQIKNQNKMGKILEFIRPFTGSFFAGYLLGFSFTVLMPRKMFKRMAVSYYEYKEIDDIPLALEKKKEKKPEEK